MRSCAWVCDGNPLRCRAGETARLTKTGPSLSGQSGGAWVSGLGPLRRDRPDRLPQQQSPHLGCSASSRTADAEARSTAPWRPSWHSSRQSGTSRCDPGSARAKPASLASVSSSRAVLRGAGEGRSRPLVDGVRLAGRPSVYETHAKSSQPQHRYNAGANCLLPGGLRLDPESLGEFGASQPVFGHCSPDYAIAVTNRLMS
jgi:hypothetical protein